MGKMMLRSITYEGWHASAWPDDACSSHVPVDAWLHHNRAKYAARSSCPAVVQLVLCRGCAPLPGPVAASFSPVQDDICVHEKPMLCTPLSLRSFPSAAFETVPVFYLSDVLSLIRCSLFYIYAGLADVPCNILFLLYIRGFCCFLMYFNHAESDVCCQSVLPYLFFG